LSPSLEEISLNTILGYFASARRGSGVAVLNDVQGVGQMMQDNLVKLLQNFIVLATTTAVIFTWTGAWGWWPSLLPAFVCRRAGWASGASS